MGQYIRLITVTVGVGKLFLNAMVKFRSLKLLFKMGGTFKKLTLSYFCHVFVVTNKVKLNYIYRTMKVREKCLCFLNP